MSRGLQKVVGGDAAPGRQHVVERDRPRALDFGNALRIEQPLGALEQFLARAERVAVLFLAVWWIWMYTAWTTNWLDPARLPVRVCLFKAAALSTIRSRAQPDHH